MLWGPRHCLGSCFKALVLSYILHSESSEELDLHETCWFSEATALVSVTPADSNCPIQGLLLSYKRLL